MLVVAQAMMFLQAASVQAPGPKDDKFITALHGYRTCVREKADLFLPARQSVRDTVDAAFFACRNERATLVFTITQIRKRTGQDDSLSKADEFVADLVDKDFREEVFVDVMTKKALREGTANR